METNFRITKELVERVLPRENTAYGLGTRIMDTGEFTLIGHGGSNTNFRSEMWLIDYKDWGFVLLTNKNHALEENYLMNVSIDIGSIIAGNDPTPVQKSTPTGRWIFLAIVVALIRRPRPYAKAGSPVSLPRLSKKV